MTPTEFKAWFDGFTESIQGVPNEKQWKRIKARVKEVHGDTVITEIVRRPWWPYWYWQNTSAPPFLASSSSSEMMLSAVGHAYNVGKSEMIETA